MDVKMKEGDKVKEKSKELEGEVKKEVGGK